VSHSMLAMHAAVPSDTAGRGSGLRTTRGR
jgi:hypothetical protein